MGRACGTYGGRAVYTVSWQGNPRKMDHLEDLKVDGRIVLEYHQRVGWRPGMDLSGSEQGKVAGACEISNGPSSSIKELPDQLRTCLLHKKDAPIWIYLVFLYVNRTAVRSTKVGCGFHKLSRQTVRCRNLLAWRYIAGGQFGKNFLAFSIYSFFYCA